MKSIKLRTNPDDFIGKVYPTNNYGDVVITAYRKSKDVTVKFLRTGHEMDTQMLAVHMGNLRDASLSLDSNKRLRGIWRGMIDRCRYAYTKDKCKYYRGVSVCEEWSEFYQFKQWAEANGYTDALSIDRIDVNGNYEPANCRWSTPREQAANRKDASIYGTNIRKKDGSFEVSAWVDGVKKYIGRFKDLELAHLVRDEVLEGVTQ